MLMGEKKKTEEKGELERQMGIGHLTLSQSLLKIRSLFVKQQKGGRLRLVS